MVIEEKASRKYDRFRLAGTGEVRLGKRDFGVSNDYLSAAMPPVNTLAGGELAWRQHAGGVTLAPNWPVFFDWAEPLLGAKAPTLDAALP